MTYYFDMDGTLADLYGVENWLPLLRAEDTKPYEIAKPLWNMSQLARLLHKVQKQGNQIGIISWGSKTGTNEFNLKTAIAKIEWLERHLPSVEWDDIIITAYGVPKQNYATDEDILFDDNDSIRADWGKNAYLPEEIMNILRGQRSWGYRSARQPDQKSWVVLSRRKR